MCRMKAQMYKPRLKRAGTCHSHAANANQSLVDRETQQTGPKRRRLLTVTGDPFILQQRATLY